MTSIFSYTINNETKTVDLEQTGDQFQVTIGHTVYAVIAHSDAQGALQLEIDGQQWPVHVAIDGSRRYVAVAGQHWTLDRIETGPRRSTARPDQPQSGRLEATMPGQVIEVLVTVGDQVERGQTLLLMEAMKMELRVTAPFAGLITQVHCQTGQVAERGQLLIELDEEPT